MISPTAAKSRQVPRARGPDRMALKSGQCRPIAAIQETRNTPRPVARNPKTALHPEFRQCRVTLSYSSDRNLFIAAAAPRHHR